MKKIVAAGLAAALVSLPVSGAFAEEAKPATKPAAAIKPLTTTKSTQTGGDSLMMGGVGPAGLVVGGLAILTVVTALANNNSSGTTR